MEIQGNEYTEVKERIQEFRNDEKYKGWMLRTDITHMDDKRVIMKAYILNEEEKVIATGIASEVEGSSFINKGSHIENCETSAWGRALGNLGIGVIGGIASKDEVENAKLNSKPTSTEKKCPTCDTKMIIREGQYGDFYGCPKYKECGQKPINIK